MYYYFSANCSHELYLSHQKLGIVLEYIVCLGEAVRVAVEEFMRKFKSFISAVAFCVVPGVFGMHGENMELSNGSVVEKARGILRNVQIVDDNMKKNAHMRLIVLLGATGSGKTSLMHALAKTSMRAAAEDGMARLAGRYAITPNGTAAVNIGKVAGGGRSVTSDVRPFKVGNIIYCDGPGFFDTNGGFTEMSNTLLMNEVLRRGVKILLVVSNDELLARRGEAAKETMDYLKSLLPDERTDRAERMAMSIGIVISKGTLSGTIGDVFAILEGKENHHWLIDYLSDHRKENAFWFPAPTREGPYEAPQDLIEGIKKFAGRRSELITGSMSLQPKAINDLVGMHSSFDVRDKIDRIVNEVSREFSCYENDLDNLLVLEGAFGTLWASLTERSFDSRISKDEMLRRWRRSSFSSDARKKFGFSLRDFVDGLDGVDHFRVICGVGEEGFGPEFEKGLVWEELVDYISRLSSTSEREISRLNKVRDNWKKGLPNLMERSKDVSRAVVRNQQSRGERIAAGAGTVIGGAVGGVVGGIMGSAAGGIGAAPGAAIGASSGAAAGASAGTAVVKFIHSVQNFFSAQRDDG